MQFFTNPMRGTRRETTIESSFRHKAENKDEFAQKRRFPCSPVRTNDIMLPPSGRSAVR